MFSVGRASFLLSLQCLDQLEKPTVHDISHTKTSQRNALVKIKDALRGRQAVSLSHLPDVRLVQAFV